MRNTALAALAVIALAAAGCGSSKLASEASTNPQAKQAETLVQGCVSKGGSLAATESCVAPPGHSAALKSCVIHAAVHDFYNQPKLIKALIGCVEANR